MDEFRERCDVEVEIRSFDIMSIYRWSLFIFVDTLEVDDIRWDLRWREVVIPFVVSSMSRDLDSGSVRVIP
jgi:hypothetical protein